MLFSYKAFNLSPNNSNNIIGTANKPTINVFVENKEGFNSNVIAKPPIAPPKCAE